MTKNCRRLARLFCCLLICATVAFAADPAKTLIQEAIFGNKSGADKKEAALKFVASALSITEAVTKKEIVDIEKFNGGLDQIIDGTVQCLNASAWAKTK